jgi:Uma2 family endonuclease
MLQVPEKALTLEEFLDLPETKPASEFINKQIIQKPMPKGKHSSLQSRLVAWINQVALEKEIAHGFTELRCTFGGRSIIPDVSVFSWDRIPFDADGEIANDFMTYPDWTIEILSPGQSISKTISNILHCLDYGTQLGWLLDPSEKLAIAFLPKQQPIAIADDQKLPVPNLLELDLTASQMFGWLKKNASQA